MASTSASEQPTVIYDDEDSNLSTASNSTEADTISDSKTPIIVQFAYHSYSIDKTVNGKLSSRAICKSCRETVTAVNSSSNYTRHLRRHHIEKL